jgi:hypothetical protein
METIDAMSFESLHFILPEATLSWRLLRCFERFNDAEVVNMFSVAAKPLRNVYRPFVPELASKHCGSKMRRGRRKKNEN